MESTALEEPDDSFVGCLDGFFFTIWDGFCMDGIAIIIIKYEKIVVATRGGDNKSTGLVGANVTGDCATISEDSVGTLLGWLWDWSSGDFFGGLYVGALRMHVAHCSSFGAWRILSDLFRCEVWPGIEVASIDGVRPGRENRGKKSCVIERNAVLKIGNLGSHGIGPSIVRCW